MEIMTTGIVAGIVLDVKDLGDAAEQFTVDRSPSRCTVLRTVLSRNVVVVAIICLTIFLAYRLCLREFGEMSTAAGATRSLCALGGFTLSAAISQSVDLRVLRMLVTRPRVLYFVGGVVISEVLILVMKIANQDEMSFPYTISVVLAGIASCGVFVIVPLFDSCPRSAIGSTALRTLVVLAAGVKAFFVINCKADQHTCMIQYKNFVWEVSEPSSAPEVEANATSNITSTNNTAHVKTHGLFSTLDIVFSCHSIVRACVRACMRACVCACV